MSMPDPARSYRHVLPLVILVALLSAAGCGFQPRGHAMADAGIPGPVYISGIATFSDLHRELYRQLKIAGTQTASSAADGAVTLRITDLEADTRLLSVNSRNRAVEFELIESATFSLTSRQGQELLAPQKVSVLHIQYRPEVAILGSDREAELLRQDMREELAGRIIRRLSAQYSQIR